ncbi:MAG: GH92 family glycosyl hydrolase [Bacteroidales bacterium]|jgi:predicted alpha-1,2-mannosidase|nr:GH92 family glycosyl hydrolase [Bacteroidales bacterium]MDD3700717.1 GH92 family glycosyl hydrolase [Bacteroidales bacterium]MDY0369391.1 GH92 family glycosyl hydrolase [Bacteroidales bacterium]
MKKKFSVILLVTISLLQACTHVTINEPASFIDPFIGTDGHGHTYPGAATPFGMVQLSPQTRLDGWDGCSGYHYTDSILYGFAHTALNGTGVSDYGDILLMPVVGEPAFANTQYNSSFSKENEYAEAGYYSVFLDEPQVWAEMTATTRVGYHRYTFPETEQAHIIIDLTHRDFVLDSWIEFISPTEIRGMRRSSNWAKDMVWFFYMEFSNPFKTKGIAINDQIQQGSEKASGNHIKAFVGFDTEAGETIEVKVALSAVDTEGALQNLKAELPEWGFEAVRKQAYDTWNAEVGKIKVKGGTAEQNTVFYTAMYHAMLQPNTFTDIDGRYRGMDRKIHQAGSFTQYTVFSLWDTYRAWHPLMTIIEQKRSNEFIRSMLRMYEQGGLLPIWELAGNETYCMIGNHSISVITDAWMKGIRGFDGDQALDAMLHSISTDRSGLDAYRQDGYIAGDKEHESISKTLEYAYNDWCIAMMAKDMGREQVYHEYIRRAQSWKNIFDPQTGFMRPKLNSNWLNPFDPTVVDWHFTEANSWHYSFYVPQDISGFIELHGGKEKLEAKIDELFTTETDVGGRDMKDITGLIGQYAQGNEPSHHMAYLYNYVNRPWKTQERVRQIMDELYTHHPDGLSGNEDCGQMSAWLIMSAMGFYPVTPGSTTYVVGTPWFPETIINLENGNQFIIRAKSLSKQNFYIQSANYNGQPFHNSFITHDMIMQGGELEFVMGDKPGKWAIADENIPVSAIKDELILPVPYFISDTEKIKDRLEVAIATIVPDCEIYYTLDGSVPDTLALSYSAPIQMTEAGTIRAVAWKEDYGYSHIAESKYVKLTLDRHIELLSVPHPNYQASGPEALIDGLRGASNWRLGGWMGFQGKDMETVIDLETIQPIHKLAAGFVQDIRSWIWMPTEVRFYVSDDGQEYTHITTVKNKLSDTDYEIHMMDLGAKVNTNGRYVKMVAKNYGTIPEWHLGAGGDAYIFADEIIIE